MFRVATSLLSTNSGMSSPAHPIVSLASSITFLISSSCDARFTLNRESLSAVLVVSGVGLRCDALSPAHQNRHLAHTIPHDEHTPLSGASCLAAWCWARRWGEAGLGLSMKASAIVLMNSLPAVPEPVAFLTAIAATCTERSPRLRCEEGVRGSTLDIVELRRCFF